MTDQAPEAVDLVVNTFERTYRRALAPGVVSTIAQSNRYPFAHRIALINNVDDEADAVARAECLRSTGEIDEFHLVAEHLESALRLVGLRRSQLEPLLHYSEAPLVAASIAHSQWLLYWDPEARLSEGGDWITPALALMKSDARAMVANPSWEPANNEGRRPGVEREAISTRDGFALGHGFSDQVFLVARASLAAPIYDQRCIARICYPGAHKAHVFEARVAAHMRHHDRLRATSLTAAYVIDGRGASAYPPSGPLELARYARNALMLRALSASPWRPACLRRTWL